MAGWKVSDNHCQLPEQSILIIAPHTSMWDFIWGKMMLSVLGLRVKFLIKQEAFWFPLGIILKAMGGIPVNRRRGRVMIQQVVNVLENNKKVTIVITPEGTRAPTKNWKKGFYHIAIKAGVPVVAGFLDYGSLTYGADLVFKPSGDYERDFIMIAKIYKGRQGKYKDRFLIPETNIEE